MSVLCRTCLRPITHETRTEPGYLPREGWYDDAHVDALVCFSAIDYRHVPLTDRERAYYDAGGKAADARVAEFQYNAVEMARAADIAEARAEGAEAAIEAARDVLDGWEHDGPDDPAIHLLIRRVREALGWAVGR